METIDIAMCTDCAMVVANDDTSGMTEDRAAAIYARLEFIAGQDLLPIVGDGDEFFSWSPCDICLDTHGGSRLDGVLLPY